jgi:uncharacterized protein (DUF488 family)
MMRLMDVRRLAGVVLGAGFGCVRAKGTAMPPVLFTVGYERHSEPDSLVAALAAARVERLVDVRELPLSRRRGFSKTALKAAVEEAGLTYEHERALGNPKPYRDLYKAGDQATGERLYRAHLRNGSSQAVDWLSGTLEDQRTCILCVEHDHRECHRSVIVEQVRERLPELRVEHL